MVFGSGKCSIRWLAVLDAGVWKVLRFGVRSDPAICLHDCAVAAAATTATDVSTLFPEPM